MTQSSNPSPDLRYLRRSRLGTAFVRLPRAGWSGSARQPHDEGGTAAFAVALGAGVLAPEEASLLFWTVIACVGVSIVVHGVTATPLIREVVDDPPDL